MRRSAHTDLKSKGPIHDAFTHAGHETGFPAVQGLPAAHTAPCLRIAMHVPRRCAPAHDLHTSSHAGTAQALASTATDSSRSGMSHA